MRFSGSKLRTLREAHGLTRPALAKRCGIHRDALRNLERAHRQPSITLLAGLATALDIPVGDLFENTNA